MPAREDAQPAEAQRMYCNWGASGFKEGGGNGDAWYPQGAGSMREKYKLKTKNFLRPACMSAALR